MWSGPQLRLRPTATCHSRILGDGMPTKSYLQKQADVFLRLAILSADEERARRLYAMAESYRQRAQKVTASDDSQSHVPDSKPSSQCDRSRPDGSAQS